MHRHWVLFVVAAVMVAHAVVVGIRLPSAFFIFAFCWGWVAVTILFDRLDAAAAMTATMTGLLLVLPAAVQMTPLGQGEVRAFYSLAWFPALIAAAAVWAYVHHIQRRASLPNVSFDAVIGAMSVPMTAQEVETRALAAEEFARSMVQSAAARGGRSTPAPGQPAAAVAARGGRVA